MNMANFLSENHLILILLCTIFTWQSSNSTKTKRSLLDNALDDSHEEAVDKRYTNFRNDLGKRDLEKRFSHFNNDLGKRSDFDSDEAFDADIKRIVLGMGDDMSKRSSFRYDLGKRYAPYRNDLGKRVGKLDGAEGREDLLETIKRYGGIGFRADLGKRSSEEQEDIDALRDFLLQGAENKRAYPADLGKRYSGFNADLGKRSSFRYDLGKRQYFRADLGKRASFRHDLGKRASFNADLGKRPSFRADLGKRSVDGTKRQQGD